MEEKKKSLVGAYIAIAAIIVLVGAATYAYFSASQNIESNISLEVNISGESYSFWARAVGNIAMNITPAMMDEAVSNNDVEIASDNANIIVELSSPDANTLTTCTYDIVWNWTSNDIYTSQNPTAGKNKITPTSGAINEFTASIDNETEFNIANKPFITNTNDFVISSESISSSSPTPTVKTSVINAKFYNLDLNQDNLKNKNFGANIVVQNVNCSMASELSSVGGISFYEENTLAEIVLNDLSNAGSLQVLGGMYRYTSNVERETYTWNTRPKQIQADGIKNFICLGSNIVPCPNDNLYRVIGVTKNDKYNNGTIDIYSNPDGLVKVIKANGVHVPELEYPWEEMYPLNLDDSEENADFTKWSNSDLYKRIIGTYTGERYDPKSIFLGTTTFAYIQPLVSQGIITPANWRMKDIAHSVNTYTFITFNANNAYSLENESKNYKDDTNLTKLATADIFYGTFGLASISDFLYSNSSNAIDFGNDNDDYELNLKGWMYTYPYDYGTSEWTINRHGWQVDNYDNGFVIGWYAGSGGKIGGNLLSEASSFRPVFYLSSLAKVTGSGNGSLNNPYIVLGN